jgi:hypothetical protein
MTCFWDALRDKLNIKKNNKEFISHLKGCNKKDNSILWNDVKLTQKQLEENFEHIRDFNEKNINNGYDCSICDPFLILICEIYNVNILHNYNGYKMKYTKEGGNKTLNFNSNTGHFS